MGIFLQSLLIAIWGGLCQLDQSGPHLGFRKPLLASVGVGIILGDLQTAIIIGATLELMWLGVNNIGAYVPPDVISGTVVGASVGILGGGDTSTAISTAVAVAVPVSLLVQQINMIIMTTNISLVHRADKIAEGGKAMKLSGLHFVGGLMFFLSRAVPVFLAVYFGSQFVQNILDSIPANVLAGFSVASKIIPAVGLAMLLTLMMKKNMWIFLLIGFVMSAYLKLPLLAVAMIGASMGALYDIIIENGKVKVTNSVVRNEEEEEEYDL
ncbi:PTS mannose/fructose/sorbose/N-acetylgalactosamine transporter subunit IIC [Helcococcus kunzii]|uniref:PTS mannose/fructose/sorbose/N-acetylgalactosamine transporter subunit IIC n=1 Tax=Helcococcus kunzii TaxID=40091 RepID=UPI0024AE2CC2|nr:PTS sugar transporter subunit IIC [Helcococcus kunzii]